jgi:hypothetical protein
MELDLVEPVAVPVEALQHRRMAVGVEAELHGLRTAEDLAERRQPGLGPATALARQRVAQGQIRLEQIVRFQRRGLIADVEHPRSLPSFLAPKSHASSGMELSGKNRVCTRMSAVSPSSCHRLCRLAGPMTKP